MPPAGTGTSSSLTPLPTDTNTSYVLGLGEPFICRAHPDPTRPGSLVVIFLFLLAGLLLHWRLISLFIPSGVGHWAVQGPFTVPAAANLHPSQAATAMAVAWASRWPT